VDWRDEGVSGDIRERRFDVARSGRVVPGVLWTPSASDATALVLIGHGASGHKHTDYVIDVGRAFARRGMAAAAIDGPVHGDRRSDQGRHPQLTFLEFCQVWSSDPSMIDEMVADWSAVLDELLALEEIGGPVGWWGVSMGTILGLPFVAADQRVDAAVLGLMGLTGPTRERFATDAPKVDCPLLFLVQWNDEMFPRHSAFELFDAFGATDKRLVAHPGRHGELPSEAFRLSESFLARRLAADRST
jgi:dienelactone hydrolase